jgi:uncharacterized membrane protein YqiK
MTQVEKETSTTRKLLATLKLHNPHRVAVYSGDTDDEPRKVAVPTRRRKWSQVIAAITARPWSRVELLDKAGDVLGYVDNDAEAGDVEDLGTSRALAGQAGQVMLAERMNAMCERAAERALSARRTEVDMILRANAAVVEQMTSAMSSMATTLREVADAREEKANAEADAALAAAAAADGDQMKQLVEALPMLVQALPALRAMLAGKAS